MGKVHSLSVSRQMELFTCAVESICYTAGWFVPKGYAWEQHRDGFMLEVTGDDSAMTLAVAALESWRDR